MYLENHTAFLAARMSDRVSAMFGDLDVGNGTPLAAALADALALDLRISGRGAEGEEVLDSLSEERLVELAIDLKTTIVCGDTSFDMPLGTRVESRKPADFTVGGEHWILDAGRPGLHSMEDMRRDAHGPNLDLLRAHIERRTRRLACRRIGLPSAHFIVDTDDRHLLQFPSFGSAGEVKLQCWANGTDAPRFCAALPSR